MRTVALRVITSWLLSQVSYVCARDNGSLQYISLDVYSGTLEEPCTNDLDGWSPSFDALRDPKRCYGTEGYNITCISRRMERLNDQERMLSTASLNCAIDGFQNNDCAGSTYWPAQFDPQHQTWNWAWDVAIGLENVASVSIVCQE